MKVNSGKPNLFYLFYIGSPKIKNEIKETNLSSFEEW
jgi:hypothetical protein